MLRIAPRTTVIMITKDVIKEIYKSYSKPEKHREALNIPYFIDLLKPYHDLTADDMEIVVGGVEEFSPFKRFLIRSLHAILEFDRDVAFVFNDHILFFSKINDNFSVNFKPESKSGIFSRLFGDL